MREQLANGVIEQVPENPSGNIVHYVPHQPVIRENAEKTKVRIVYDCSSKTNERVPFLKRLLRDWTLITTSLVRHTSTKSFPSVLCDW